MTVTRHLRLIFAIGTALAQSSGTGSIAGIVIDGPDGDPVRKAIVTLTWHGEPKSWATLRTGSDGRFKFEGLPGGNYDLRAEKQGVGTATYGADHSGELGELIPLADGQTRDGLKLHFLHSSTISGRVVDPDGDPVSSVKVTLRRPGRNLGERVLISENSVGTNDRGEYKLENIQPGHYYVCANPPRFSMDGGATELAGVYSGDTRDWKESTMLTVRDGESLTGINFHVHADPRVPLHGRVTGVAARSEPNQSPPSQLPIDANGRAMRAPVINAGVVNVTVISLNEVDPWNMGIGVAPPDYKFNGPEVPSGRYRLDASESVDGKTYAASQIVDVQFGMGDIELALAPASDVKGHLRLEGGTPSELSAIQIGLSRTGSYRGFFVAHPAADGSFTIAQVPPGEWELNITGTPHGGFEKSVTLGDKDVRFKRLEISSGSDAALNIVLSLNTATIRGEVDGANGSRAGILLAPTGNFHDLTRFYYAVQCDDDGKFKMAGIAPGKYKIFALEKLTAANYRSPEAADALDALIEGGAQEIDLAERASLEVHPKLIPFEKAREVTP